MVATDLGLETLKLGAKSTSFLHKGRLPQALRVTKSCLMLTLRSDGGGKSGVWGNRGGFQEGGDS